MASTYTPLCNKCIVIWRCKHFTIIQQENGIIVKYNGLYLIPTLHTQFKRHIQIFWTQANSMAKIIAYTQKVEKKDTEIGQCCKNSKETKCQRFHCLGLRQIKLFGAQLRVYCQLYFSFNYRCLFITVVHGNFHFQALN